MGIDLTIDRFQKAFAFVGEIQQRFEKFDKKNPKVYELFKKFSLKLASRGHTRVGSKLIIERIRWEAMTSTVSEDEFKINNNYTSRYARKFVKDFPQHWNLFELRGLKS